MRKKKPGKTGWRYILMVRPNISSTQATSDASAATHPSANSFDRSCEPGLFSGGLSKESGDDPDPRRERRSRIQRKQGFHPSWGIGGFDLVVYECEERLHYRDWRSWYFRGLSGPPDGDHNVCADCAVRLGHGHAGRHDQRPLSGLFTEH